MTQDEAEKSIKEVFPNKLMLNKKEVVQITGRSMSALDRDISDGTGVSYKKVRGRVLYPITEVARWMIDLIETN